VNASGCPIFALESLFFCDFTALLKPGFVFGSPRQGAAGGKRRTVAEGVEQLREESLGVVGSKGMGKSTLINHVLDMPGLSGIISA